MPAPTTTQPNYAATDTANRLLWIGVTQTAERNGVLVAEADALKVSVQSTDDQKNRDKSDRDNKTQVVQQAARMTEWANHATATQVYPTQIIVAANAEAQAKFAPIRAVTEPILQLAMAFVSVCIPVLLFVALRRPMVAPVAEQEPDPFPELTKANPALMHVGDTLDMDRTPPGETLKFSAFCVYALNGFNLGKQAVEEATPYTRAEYKEVYEWLLVKKQYIAAKLEGGLGLSPSGVVFCDEWLKYNPLPLEDTPKEAVAAT